MIYFNDNRFVKCVSGVLYEVDENQDVFLSLRKIPIPSLPTFNPGTNRTENGRKIINCRVISFVTASANDDSMAMRLSYGGN